MTLLTVTVTLLASYLIGAVPFGYVVARARGVDILSHGSGNIGATNVGRVLGQRWGLLVFALDFAKGALPVLIATVTAPHLAGDLAPGVLPVTAAVAAFLGHLFPVYLRFRGGKGVATGVGTLAVLLPYIAVAALLAWATLLAVTRYVSVASLGAAALMLGLRLTLTPQPFSHEQLAVTLFCILGAVLVWARHATNLRRLAHGTENRFEDTPTMQLLGKTIHVLALGLWFGSAVFFTLTGLVMAREFEALGEMPRDQRPLWFPLPKEYEQERPGERFPEPLRKEQGLRAFGAAVSPLFRWYFGLQMLCAGLTLMTAVAWLTQKASRGDHLRVGVLFAALVTVAIGWWLEHVVSDLRKPRNEKTDVLLVKTYVPTTPGVTEEEKAAAHSRALAEAQDARAAFGRWHGYSLMVNLLTLVLVTVAMGLAAALPPHPPTPSPKEGAG